MKQWEKRIIILNNVFSFLSTGSKNILNREDVEKDIVTVIDYAFENSDDIKLIVEKFLTKDWNWDRILNINKAILIMAYAESKTLGTDKGIIIEEAIKTAKNYSDKNSYKFINSILDKIL